MKLIWTLRGLALALLLFLAFKPVATRPDPGAPDNWAVLIDASKSMRVADPEVRMSAAKAIVPSLLDQLKKSKLMTFSGKTEPVSPDALETIAAAGAQSDLAGAITSAFSDPTVKGAVILSDGRHVGTGDPITAAASTGKPLLLLGFGDRALFKDVAIRRIQSPPFAFKNVPTALSATVAISGYAGKKIAVKIREGERILSVQTIEPSANDFESTVTFSWTPGSIGSRYLIVEASQMEGEITMANNRKEVSLDVGRDRFRVLYICGVPGPEYGYLRYQFKADPAVELVTFVILRNASNVVSVPESELSLIPFPTQETLISQLPSFDLIVFEEFSYWEFGLMPTVLQAIRRRVEEGGSFLLMGGPIAFGPGSQYGLPGIEEMIPVQVGSPEVAAHRGALRFDAKVPAHPVLRVVDEPVRNEETWKSLPMLEDVTLIPSFKPGATVLGSVSAGGREHPVLTVWKFGKGRVAALTARTTWRWSLVQGNRGQSSDVYQQFWKNMVLWLTHSDQYKTVRVAVDARQVKLGEPTSVRVWVYDEYFKPISDADVRLQVTGPNEFQQTLVPNVETSGVFVAPFKSETLGTFRVQAWVSRKGRRYGDDSQSFRVIESQAEEEDLRPDFSLLKDLAQVTDGRFVSAKDFSPVLLEEFDRTVSSKSGRKVLLWNSKWILALLLLVLLAEWALRKRKGLP